MSDNVLTIPDLMQETPANAYLPLVCHDVCHTPPTSLGSLNGIALYSLGTRLRWDLMEMEEQFLQEMNAVRMSLARQCSLLDQLSARYTFWDRHMDKLTHPFTCQDQNAGVAQKSTQASLPLHWQNTKHPTPQHNHEGRTLPSILRWQHEWR